MSNIIVEVTDSEFVVDASITEIIVELSGEQGPPGPAASQEFVFHFGDATPSFLMTIPANKLILEAQIIITTPFNGTSPSLSIGSAASYNDVMDTIDNIPSELSTWTVNPNTVYGVNTPVSLKITPGAGATAGAGIVTLTVQY